MLLYITYFLVLAVGTIGFVKFAPASFLKETHRQQNKAFSLLFLFLFFTGMYGLFDVTSALSHDFVWYIALSANCLAGLAFTVLFYFWILRPNWRVM